MQQHQFQQFPIRPFFVTPIANKKKKKSAKVEAQPVEEAAAAEDEASSEIDPENLIFMIKQRCKSVDKLLEFEQTHAEALNHVHRSILLAHLRTLLVEQGETLSAQMVLNAQNAYQKVGK